MSTASESLHSLPAAGDSRGGELSNRVLYLMLFRLVLISLVLGATILLSWLGDVDLSAPNSLVLFAIIGTTYLLTLIYAVAIRRGTDPMRLADAQVAADLVTTTLLVHVTGGAQSAYTFFFPLTIIGAATIRFRIGAVMTTLVSAALFVGIAALGWWEVLPATEGQRVSPADLERLGFLRAVGLNLAAFAGVGFLAVNLGAQIQQTSESLDLERTAAADLYALHEDIVRSLSSGLITVDTEEIVLTINRAACEILGTQPGRSVGRPITDLLPGIHKKLVRIGEVGSVRRGDMVVHRDGAADLVLGITITPLRNNRDDVLGRIVAFQDLTELRQMEQQIEQAERLAAIGQLAAGVAHEIRNPLASISGSVELLRSAPDNDDEDNAALKEIITREIDRLNNLINDLLDYTNPAQRAVAEFDLAELVGETLKVFEQDRDFEEVTVAASEGIPETGVVMNGDPSRIRQVLWNLLRNAAEAASSGGGEVTVALEHIGRIAIVRVSDNGPGIDPQHLERVFDPFFTTKNAGSGLGLATTHSIVIEHGGTIRAKSELGQGCEFIVRLPTQERADAAGERTSGEQRILET